jgi:hypothetical protein
VVLLLVARQPLLDERPGTKDREQQAHRADGRNEDVHAPRVVEQVELEVGHESHRALGEAHVPVRLRACGDL